MNSMNSAPRWARALPASLVAASVLTAVAMPAEAVVLRSSFAQTTPIFLGDDTAGGANPTDLAIPDGKASLYPSEVVITQAARITDVDVLLEDLTHTFPDDVEVMLVGPGGQQVVLMNDAGGFGDIDVDLHFDDEAGSAIPDSDQLISNRVRPASHGSVSLTAPAPAPTGNTSLSVFDGTQANGTWKLFVYDDDGGAVGALDEWALVLETETVPYPSEVSVSGIGPVTDLDVRLDDLTSGYAPDVDLLLVGPQGQQSTLMSDIGGYYAVSDVDLTLDDEASAEMSAGTTLASGSFRPTNVSGLPDLYPAPAPTPSGSAALSVFDGTDPNGVWRLFASDNLAGDFTEIGGWSLDIAWNDAGGPVSNIATISDHITVDATGPSARKVKPGKNATGVKATAKVKAFAAEALAPASVTKTSVVLRRGGSKVNAKVGYDSAKHLIVLTPKKALKKGTYRVTVTTKVTDLAGNAWDQVSKPGAQPLRWSFTV